MRIFLWSVLIAVALGLVSKLLLLSNAKYPRTVERSDDALAVAGGLIWLVLCVVLLHQ